MPGLDLVTLPVLLALAASPSCAAAPPVVEMDFRNNPPIQRTDLSGRELGTFHVSTTFAKSRNEIFTVGGLTLSEFAPQFFMELNAPVDLVTHEYCLSVKSIEITVNYQPTIYIAKEFNEGSCRFRQILQHEARHVNTDIIAFNEYLPVLRDAVAAAASKINAVKLTNAEGISAVREKFLDLIKQALIEKTNEIEKVRFNRQQAIDTRQEYMRLSRMCEDEPLPRP